MNNIRQLYSAKLPANNFLFGANFVMTEKPEWLSFYENNKNEFDLLFITRYPFFIPLTSYDGEYEISEELTAWNSLNRAVLLKNFESYNRIWLALTKEYNPIENYDRYEDISRSFAQRDNSSTIGSQSNSTTTGAQSNTYTNGAHTDTLTEKVAPYDTNTMSNRSQNESAIGQSQDSQSLGSRSDSQSLGSRSDSETLGAHTDTETNHMHGNIGTTKNTEMVEDEILLRLKYRFIDILFKDIAGESLYYSDGGIDAWR